MEYSVGGKDLRRWMTEYSVGGKDLRRWMTKYSVGGKDLHRWMTCLKVVVKVEIEAGKVKQVETEEGMDG